VGSPVHGESSLSVDAAYASDADLDVKVAGLTVSRTNEFAQTETFVQLAHQN
jgi:hypothetical protein